MAIADAGTNASSPREAEALRTLQSGVLQGLEKKFQVRLYRVDQALTRLDHAENAHPEASATHLGESLRRLTAETADLPVGAVVLLSDGAENSGGIDPDTIAALRNRRLPVHTIGFGREHPTHDLELDDATVAPRALAGSRLSATVTLHQHGFSGAHTTLTLRDGAKTLAQRDITLAPDATTQTETLFFDAGPAGVKTLAITAAPLPNEENLANNQLTRLVDISGEKRRILYVEGEPRWEYKFLRRAADDDPSLQLVSMLRTTENKIYRQGIADPKELAEGFPTRPEDLFAYQGILIGSVEAGFFTPTQQQLLREFVDRRGGGLLFLGGRFSLAEGGWGASSDADLLPTFLPNAHGTFHRDPATTQLTAAGQSSPITRLVDDPARNADRWRTLPYLADFQDPGTPKPGATVPRRPPRRRPQPAAPHHADLRSRPHRPARHLRNLALADGLPPLATPATTSSGSSSSAGSPPPLPARSPPAPAPRPCSTKATSSSPPRSATSSLTPPPTPTSPLISSARTTSPPRSI